MDNSGHPCRLRSELPLGYAVQEEGSRCLGGKTASPLLCGRPESLDSLHWPKPYPLGSCLPTAQALSDSQPGWLTRNTDREGLSPSRGPQPATATVALIMEEPKWPGAPLFKHCTCHMVINGCGISFDRNSMAWNRLCTSLLCLRQSAY